MKSKHQAFNRSKADGHVVILLVVLRTPRPSNVNPSSCTGEKTPKNCEGWAVGRPRCGVSLGFPSCNFSLDTSLTTTLRVLPPATFLAHEQPPRYGLVPWKDCIYLSLDRST
eukprot:1578683-Amphidinium_carterae.1